MVCHVILSGRASIHWVSDKYCSRGLGFRYRLFSKTKLSVLVILGKPTASPSEGCADLNTRIQNPSC